MNSRNRASMQTDRQTDRQNVQLKRNNNHRIYYDFSKLLKYRPISSHANRVFLSNDNENNPGLRCQNYLHANYNPYTEYVCKNSTVINYTKYSECKSPQQAVICCTDWTCCEKNLQESLANANVKRATAVHVWRHMTSIGTTVAKFWPFLYVQDGRQPPSWILSNRK